MCLSGFCASTASLNSTTVEATYSLETRSAQECAWSGLAELHARCILNHAFQIGFTEYPFFSFWRGSDALTSCKASMTSPCLHPRSSPRLWKRMEGTKKTLRPVPQLRGCFSTDVGGFFPHCLVPLCRPECSSCVCFFTPCQISRLNIQGSRHYFFNVVLLTFPRPGPTWQSGIFRTNGAPDDHWVFV